MNDQQGRQNLKISSQEMTHTANDHKRTEENPEGLPFSKINEFLFLEQSAGKATHDWFKHVAK